MTSASGSSRSAAEPPCRRPSGPGSGTRSPPRRPGSACRSRRRPSRWPRPELTTRVRAIEVHHLNCGSMCPTGKRLFTGKGGLLEKHKVVAHCLLIESDDGLVLVDTGFGTARRGGPEASGHPRAGEGDAGRELETRGDRRQTGQGDGPRPRGRAPHHRHPPRRRPRRRADRLPGREGPRPQARARLRAVIRRPSAPPLHPEAVGARARLGDARGRRRHLVRLRERQAAARPRRRRRAGPARRPLDGPLAASRSGPATAGCSTPATPSSSAARSRRRARSTPGWRTFENVTRARPQARAAQPRARSRSCSESTAPRSRSSARTTRRCSTRERRPSRRRAYGVQTRAGTRREAVHDAEFGRTMGREADRRRRCVLDRPRRRACEHRIEPRSREVRTGSVIG